MSDLYWHCASCGVMTLREAARLEQRIALGMPRKEADALFVASLAPRPTTEQRTEEESERSTNPKDPR